MDREQSHGPRIVREKVVHTETLGRVSHARCGEIENNRSGVSNQLSQTVVANAKHHWKLSEQSAHRMETRPTHLESCFPPILESCNGNQAASNSIRQSQISTCAPNGSLTYIISRHTISDAIFNHLAIHSQ